MNLFFIKKFPLHPKDRLARAIKQQKEKEEVKFIKQVPLHPRQRLKRAAKTFQHPRDKMKNREQEIARENISDLMNGKFSLDSKKISNKTLLFDTTKTDKEILVDMIIRALLADNDDFYIEHLHESISFTLKRQGEI